MGVTGVTVAGNSTSTMNSFLSKFSFAVGETSADLASVDLDGDVLLLRLEAELKRILDLELALVQRRVFTNTLGTPFLFKLTDSAKAFLLREGTDLKYGARHLKRAIERHLVYPMSNLIATDQVRSGDLVQVDFDAPNVRLTFTREMEGMPTYAMVAEAGIEPSLLASVGVASATIEPAVAAMAVLADQGKK